jgi:hypothetical protein
MESPAPGPRCRFDFLPWTKEHSPYFAAARAGYFVGKHHAAIQRLVGKKLVRFWRKCLVLEFAEDGDVSENALASLAKLFGSAIPGLVVSADSQATQETAIPGSVVQLSSFTPDAISLLDQLMHLPVERLIDIDIKRLAGMEWIAVGLCFERIIVDPQDFFYVTPKEKVAAWLCELLGSAGPEVTKEVVDTLLLHIGVQINIDKKEVDMSQLRSANRPRDQLSMVGRELRMMRMHPPDRPSDLEVLTESLRHASDLAKQDPDSQDRAANVTVLRKKLEEYRFRF